MSVSLTADLIVVTTSKRARSRRDLVDDDIIESMVMVSFAQFYTFHHSGISSDLTYDNNVFELSNCPYASLHVPCIDVSNLPGEIVCVIPVNKLITLLVEILHVRLDDSCYANNV